MHSVLGLDIGGANLKAATNHGDHYSAPFPLWKQKQDLSRFLKTNVLPKFAAVDMIAVTMTGELCDCFDSKKEGVEFIVNAMKEIDQNKNILFYSVDGRFKSSDAALKDPLLFAASNWHALASYCKDNLLSLKSDEVGIVIDCGSTTTDIIPVDANSVQAIGNSDTTRIANHELVYTGSDRSPVVSVCNQVTFRQTVVTLAQEMFATMGDVYLVLEARSPDESNTNTADGRPADLIHAKKRLARMVCADLSELNSGELEDIANQVATKQRDLIRFSLHQVLQRFDEHPKQLLISGSGSFVLESVLDRMSLEIPTTSIASQIGTTLSSVLPAYAVAILANARV